MSPQVQIERLRGPRMLVETVEAGAIEAVAIDDLKLDHTYQRDLSADLVQKMAEDWDMAVAGAIVVSRRPSGQLYIVDGQHRAAAAKLAGETHVLAQVLENQGRQQEATLRLKGNVRRGDKAQERFRAQIAAGNKESKAIVQIAENFETRINPWPDSKHGLNCVSSIEEIYRIDHGVLLTRTFDVVSKAWGPPGGQHGTVPVLKGIAWMLTKHGGELNVARLVERMRDEGPESLDRKGRAHKAAMGGSLWLNWYRAAVEIYNHRLPDGSKLSWVTGGWSADKKRDSW